MGTTAAAIVSLLPVAAGLYAAYRQTRRAIRHDAQRREQFIRSTVGPVVDTQPGTDLAVQDDLELAWSMDAYDGLDLDAGLNRLRQAIREQQQNGEQA